MSSFTLWLNLLLHLVVYLLSCFDVLICLIFFLFALIKFYPFKTSVSYCFFWYFAACLSCLCFLPVLRSCFSAFWSYLYLFLTFVVSMYRNLFIFCKSVFYLFFCCSPYGLSLPLSSLQVGIPCCLLLYSILANFPTNKMTNWDQMNIIPSDLKSFMREFIHELGMLHTHITCLLISSRIPLSSPRGTTDARATCHTRPGSYRRTYQ